MRRAGLLLALVGLLAAAAWADYRQSYLDGVRAARRGDWEEAARRLAEAARERPREQARARLVGAIPEPYLPHHYLGLAHYHLRRCAEALREWRFSAEHGAIAGLPALRAEADGYRQDCEVLAAAEEAVAAGRGSAEGLASSDLAPVLAAEPALERRRREALDRIAAAEERLGAGREGWDFALVGEAGRQAQAAAAELAALEGEVRRRRAEAVARAGEPPQAETPEQLGPEAAGGAASASSRPEGAAVTVGGGEPVVPAPGLPGSGAPVGPPPAESTLASGAPGPRVGGDTASEALSEALVAAIQAYFDGDYAGALRWLEGDGEARASPAAPAELAAAQRRRFLAALFRSASRYALYLLEGEKDPSQLAASIEDLRVARREHPAFAPHPDHFSPRFIAFFRDHP